MFDLLKVLQALREDIIRKYYMKYDVQPSVILYIIKHLNVCACAHACVCVL